MLVSMLRPRFVPTGDKGVLPRLLELVYGFDEAGKFLAESEFVILSGGGLNPFVNEGQRQTAHGRIGL